MGGAWRAPLGEGRAHTPFPGTAAPPLGGAPVPGSGATQGAFHPCQVDVAPTGQQGTGEAVRSDYGHVRHYRPPARRARRAGAGRPGLCRPRPGRRGRRAGRERTGGAHTFLSVDGPAKRGPAGRTVGRTKEGGTAVHPNPIRALALLAGLAALVVLAGWVCAGHEGVRAAAVVVLGVTGLVCFFGDSLALRAMRARPVGEFEQPELHRVVRDLATRARQPMPRLYLSPTAAPNAFAVGRGPRAAGICCTTGLLRLLDERELRAVVAHELAHVRNRDTLVSAVAVGLATIITSLTALALLLPLDDGDDEGPGLLEGLLFLVLGPLAALVIHAGVGRRREFCADEAAARLTGDPLALASALRKIEVGARTHPLPTERRLLAAGHQMIANPFPKRGMCRLFDAHPPAAERIRRLRALDEEWRLE